MSEVVSVVMAAVSGGGRGGDEKRWR